MKRSLSTTALGAVTVMALGATAVAVAPAASAASLGSARPSIASGDANSLFNIITSAACPSSATAAEAKLLGPNGSGPLVSGSRGQWDAQLVTRSGANLPLMNSGGMPIADSLSAMASADGAVLVSGDYAITVNCYQGLATNVGTFDGVITMTAGSGTPTFVYNAPAAPASSTGLTVSPTSPQSTGVDLTLTANVSSTAPVAGTVTFKDGSTVLNATPATVTGGVATATVNTSALGGGSHSLTAVFTPSDPSVVAGSTSSAVPFTVTVPAQATTTSLTASPTAPTTVDVITLSAAVSPTAAGTVTFSEGSTVVATTSTSSGGVYSASLTGVTAGSHAYTAAFSPANPSAFVASTSSPVRVDVTTYAGASGSETITTSVASGTLTITAGGAAVDLGPASLNASNTLLITTPKDINPVTLTDTRAGNVGYTVSGVVGDFSTASGDKITSENLGWTPKVVSAPSSVNVAAGPAVAAGNGIAAGGAAGGAGLKTARVLATAAAGGSVGTTQLGASLVLQAPTTTKAGAYSATLTLTAL